MKFIIIFVAFMIAVLVVGTCFFIQEYLVRQDIKNKTESHFLPAFILIATIIAVCIIGFITRNYLISNGLGLINV